MNSEQRARELLADCLSEFGCDGAGYAVRHEQEGRENLLYPAALRAIARALEQPASAAGVEGSEVVGHKTFSDGHGGFRHEPLTRAEADVLIAHCNSEDERRKALIPDEKAAIELMMDTYIRLKEMGWNDAIYCPKDGRAFEVIEPGSTGIFKCVYQGEWPKGTWWIVEDGDMSPSRPVLFRPIAAPKPEDAS